MLNQVFLGNDPLLSSSSPLSNPSNIEEQLLMLERLRQLLEDARLKMLSPQQRELIWDNIDKEVAPLSNEQKSMLFLNEEYAETYNELLSRVLAELLNLVKGRIESTKDGKALLEKQLKLVKKLKTGIVDSTNREMEVFKKFKEYSKQHPEITYEEFLKLK